MADLSPQAQAVLDAFCAGEGGVYLEGDPDRLAAAIRALAKVTCEPDPIMGWKSTKENRLLRIAHGLESE